MEMTRYMIFIQQLMAKIDCGTLSKIAISIEFDFLKIVLFYLLNRTITNVKLIFMCCFEMVLHVKCIVSDSKC